MLLDEEIEASICAHAGLLLLSTEGAAKVKEEAKSRGTISLRDVMKNITCRNFRGEAIPRKQPSGGPLSKFSLPLS